MWYSLAMKTVDKKVADKKENRREITVLLQDIRSTHNVGSMFRTADAAGVTRMFLSGYTPAPVDRFGRPRKDIAKVALGAEKSVAWEYVGAEIGDVEKLLKKLSRQKFHIIALEQAKNSVDYKKVKIAKNQKVVFIVGQEVEGIDPALLKLCDVVAEIPMLGEKESLNVSVAFGVGLFRILGV